MAYMKVNVSQFPEHRYSTCGSRLAPTVGTHFKCGSLLAKGLVNTMNSSTLLKHLVRPLLDLLFGQIFLARGEKPQVPIRILQRPAAITIKLILDL